MISIAVSPLTTMALVAIRLGSVLLLSPIEAIRLLPIHTRLLLVFMISMLIVTNVPLSSSFSEDLSLVVSGLAECCNGLILSLGLYAAFGIFQIAGMLIDTQMGLNSVAIFNPTSHNHEPLSSRLLVMLSVLFFFAVNGLQRIVQGLVMSFTLIPPGRLAIFNGFTAVTQQFSLMFVMAIMVASPVVISLIVIDISGAILTRNMPQISTYFLILPIKIMVGLCMFGLLLTYINPLMENAFSLCFQSRKVVMS